VQNFENRLTFDKVTESLKVGTILRHSVQWRGAAYLCSWCRHESGSTDKRMVPKCCVCDMSWLGCRRSSTYHMKRRRLSKRLKRLNIISFI